MEGPSKEKGRVEMPTREASRVEMLLKDLERDVERRERFLRFSLNVCLKNLISQGVREDGRRLSRT